MTWLSALLRASGSRGPLVLVATAPVYGFEWVDFFQKLLTFFAGPHKFDYESWAANKERMRFVLQQLKGRNVVILSGDVHYGYTSTIGYTEFDSLRHDRSSSGRPTDR
jgi:hypothetical protein